MHKNHTKTNLELAVGADARQVNWNVFPLWLLRHNSFLAIHLSQTLFYPNLILVGAFVRTLAFGLSLFSPGPTMHILEVALQTPHVLGLLSTDRTVVGGRLLHVRVSTQYML